MPDWLLNTVVIVLLLQSTGVGLVICWILSMVGRDEMVYRIEDDDEDSFH